MIPPEDVQRIARMASAILATIGQDLERGQLDDARGELETLWRTLDPLIHGHDRSVAIITYNVAARASHALSYSVDRMHGLAARTLAHAEGLAEALEGGSHE